MAAGAISVVQAVLGRLFWETSHAALWGQARQGPPQWLGAFSGQSDLQTPCHASRFQDLPDATGPDNAPEGGGGVNPALLIS